MRSLEWNNFDAVAFDIEGTLADTIPTHHAARLEAFAQHGYAHITREQHELGVTYGSSTADIIGGILHAAGHIEKNGPFNQHPIVQEVIGSKTELFEKNATNGFSEMPGAADFVECIVSKFGSHLALVTSSPERFVLPFLDRYNLARYFPHDLIISEDTVMANGLKGKPAPDPYTLAMQRLDAKRLLVFEDTVSGTASAKAAGATVIALAFEPNNARLLASNEIPYPPDVLVNNYAEAKVLLGL